METITNTNNTIDYDSPARHFSVNVAEKTKGGKTFETIFPNLGEETIIPELGGELKIYLQKGVRRSVILNAGDRVTLWGAGDASTPAMWSVARA